MLGRGGFGSIVRAQSRIDDQLYAVKRIRCRLQLAAGREGPSQPQGAALDAYLHGACAQRASRRRMLRTLAVVEWAR